MLQTVEKTAIAGVVARVAGRLGTQERAAARRAKATQKITREIAQAQMKREAILDTILDHIEQGLANVLALQAEPEMNRFLDTLWADEKRPFTLYRVANGDIVTVELRPGYVLVTVKGERVSSVQSLGKSTSYTDCTLGADFPYAGPYWSGRAFFWNLFLSSLTDDSWEDVDYRSSGLQQLTARDFENRGRKVTDSHLKRFDDFSSLTLQKKTDEHLRSLSSARYDADPAASFWKQWSEMGVDVNHILSRFFYDCADPEVLGKHLSAAINNIRV